MAKKIYPISVLFLFIFLLASCKKDSLSVAEQAKIDDKIIVDYLAANSIEAEKHVSGLYFKILEPGDSSTYANVNSTVRVDYVGKFLNGQVFDEGLIDLPLGGLIEGWQNGIPLVSKGGAILLFVPSAQAYGPNDNGPIPANSVLMFRVKLLGVQ